MSPSSPTDEGTPPTLLTRPSEGRILLGVCAALARTGGVDVAVVRLVAVATVAAGGVGVALYLPLAVALPRPGTQSPFDRWRVHTATALCALVASMLVALDMAGLMAPIGLLWPTAAILAGVGLAWRQSGAPLPTAQPGRSRTGGRPLGHQVLRWLLATALILGPGAVLLAQTGGVVGAASIAITASLVAAGVGLLVGPYLSRVRTQARTERIERTRADERVAMAVRLHDSVLQTLALIQRTDDSSRSQQLARRQERELRSWLYGAAPDRHETSFGASLARAASEVEERYGVSVDVVQPADTAIDDRLSTLVAAASEAMVNAAKHSGADRVAVLARVGPREASIYVRDRGRGFDPAGVGADRRGLADSIQGRMVRLGGRVVVVSHPGQGTEVELSLPRGGP